MNGLVHPFEKKCESINWIFIRGNQLMPQGLGPKMNQEIKCDYGSIAPYISPDIKHEMKIVNNLRFNNCPNLENSYNLFYEICLKNFLHK